MVRHRVVHIVPTPGEHLGSDLVGVIKPREGLGARIGPAHWYRSLQPDRPPDQTTQAANGTRYLRQIAVKADDDGHVTLPIAHELRDVKSDRQVQPLPLRPRTGTARPGG